MSSKIVFPVLLLAFATWAVSLGGIASLQQSCKNTELEAPANVPESAILKELSTVQQRFGAGVKLPDVESVKKGGKFFLTSASMAGIRGFSATLLKCNETYRYYWFIIAFQFVAVITAVLVVAAGSLHTVRASLMGLFVIATLLYIQSADSFLTALDVSWYKHGQYQHQARTMAAGCIMTAAVNCMVVFALGLETTAATPAAK